MKLTKTVFVCGKTYKIKKDPKSFGGKGQTGPQEIIIGTKYQKPERIFENLVHEIFELILVEYGFKYETDDRELFIMTHNDLVIVAIQLAAAIMPMLKD